MTRIDLQYKLEELLGSKNVYFQPPSTIYLKYPCIIYERAAMDKKYANNSEYFRHKGYMVTLIDPNPDSLILDKISSLPFSTFDRHFVADNLNHDAYTIYIL